jgi:2-polyprenyl-6-methoxyphenol hydroxylase-like FAD-dependent oxidoreductase
MTVPKNIDVIVAGAGMAGAAAAAALAECGFQVLVAEPGLDPAKRLAGELIHPPGAEALAKLGLLAGLERAGGTRVVGFAVIYGAQKPCLLPYAEAHEPEGLALEYTALRARLLRALQDIPGVQVAIGTRIGALHLDGRRGAQVTLSENDEERTIRAQMVVAADGGASQLRKMAGIAARRQRLSTMAGLLLPDAELPHPGYGHVLLGAPGPILAYAPAPGQVRVMFDIPDNPDGVQALERDKSYLQALPEPLRRKARAELEAGNLLASANYLIVPERIVRGRLVLVGDAAGCCHPLTATGLSFCSQDGLRLRDAVREHRGHLDEALAAYEQRRQNPQRVRLALATALYEAFSSPAEEMKLLRDGLLRYWSHSPNGRAASLALLSTWESRMSVMAQEYARVLLYGLTAGIVPWDGDVPVSAIHRRGRAAVGLSWKLLRVGLQALRA